MTKHKYKSFWDTIFQPKVDSILKIDKSIEFDSGTYQTLYNLYEDYREKAHDWMYDQASLKDRHKISSIFIKSILELNPFRASHNKADIISSSKVATEIFAWHCGQSVAFSFIRERANKQGRMVQYENFSKGFVFPDTHRDGYQTHVIRLLNYSRINESFDVYTFAQVFFFLESYTMLYHRKGLTSLPEAI